MANLDMDATMQFLQSLCTSPEQQNMLQWMQAQPKPALMAFLKSSIATIPREGLEPLVHQHLAQHSVETRVHILTKITHAYDFLKAN